MEGVEALNAAKSTAPVKSAVSVKAPVANKESPKPKSIKPAVKVEENFEDSSEAEI